MTAINAIANLVGLVIHVTLVRSFRHCMIQGLSQMFVYVRVFA